MNVSKTKTGILIGFLAGSAGLLPVHGELPSLDERKWVGNFIGMEQKNFEFAMTTKGRGSIIPLGKKGTPVSSRLSVSVEFLIQETLPDGRIVGRVFKHETLESAQAATLKPANVVVRGKVTGDAAFEAYINEDRGTLSLGGKLLEPGTLTKNPIRFAIRISFPDAYTATTEKGGANNGNPDPKKAAKAFEQKTEKDRLMLKFTDGKTRKQSLADAVDASSPEINGPGISALSLEVAAYQENKFILTASENSVMALSNAGPKPLNSGFSVVWTADTAKDPDGKARIVIDVK